MCDDPGPMPAVVAAGSDATSVLRSSAENLVMAWSWMDRAEAAIDCLRRGYVP